MNKYANGSDGPISTARKDDRRHAVLQAAAMIYASSHYLVTDGYAPQVRYSENFVSAVSAAEDLLGEVEARGY